MNPFLDGGDFDLSALQDGSAPIFVASVQVSDLAPGLPVRANGSQELVGGLIELADCGFTPLTTPLDADLEMGGYAVDAAAAVILNSNASPPEPPTDNLTVFTHCSTSTTPAQSSRSQPHPAQAEQCRAQ